MQKLLLLHGVLASSGQMEPLATLLHKEYEIHTLTFAGHGSEVVDAQSFRMAHFIKQVSEFCNSLQAPVHVFGYSMGGYAAIGASPGSPGIGKIITLGTRFDWNEETASKEVRFHDPDIMEQKVPQFTAGLAASYAGQDWKQVVVNTAGMMRDLGRSPDLNAAQLRAVSKEVFIMVGDMDTTAGIEASRTAVMLIPLSVFRVLDKTPHPFEKVNLEMLAEQIRKFLR